MSTDYVALAARAACFSRLMHRGQKYGARPYFEGHVMRVADRVAADPDRTYPDMIVAYLHDVVEDTEAMLVDLLVMGFPAHIVDSVEAITRRQHEAYEHYIDRCAMDATASFVKWHDLQENHDNCHAFGEKKAGLMARYNRALLRLIELDARIGS